MDIQVVNFKPYAKDHLIGFFSLVVAGLVVNGCRVFSKGPQLWFAWPSEKVQGRKGEGEYRDIVTAAAPMMEHLQRAVRAQLRPLLEDARPAEDSGQPQHNFRPPEGENLSEYQSGPPGDDDIPF